MIPATTKPPKRKSLIIDILLIYILLTAAYFRLVGTDWGEYQYLHPDERFLVWVGTDITPLKCLDEVIPIDSCPQELRTWMGFGEYFDAATSTLNPNNRGHGFYVYGTLPMFMARFAVEWIYGHSGFNEMTDVGRPLSALADLLTVLFVYLVAARVYNRRAGLLAAAFSALAVMQIQLSHYFTMDTFLGLFTYLAIYFAVRVAAESWGSRSAVNEGAVSAEDQSLGDGAALNNEPVDPEPGVGPVLEAIATPALPAQAASQGPGFERVLRSFIRHPYFGLSLAFGFALGCAVASKLNSAPVAVMLPAAFGLTLLPVPAKERSSRALHALAYLMLAALVSLLVFRLFQPYAFSGPGLLGLKPNPDWVSNIREQRIQAAGDVDFPPAIQWARRPVWFSGQNLVLWGLGLPLGVLAWAGFLWAGWRMLADRSPYKDEWRRHGLLWTWTAFYFIWQSLAFNPTMRYQFPVYPSLAIFAGWAVVAWYDWGRQKASQPLPPGPGRLRFSGKAAQFTAILVGGSVLLATLGWAYAFTRIYVRPITRVEASRWIYQNLPGPINLKIQTADEIYNQPIPFPDGLTIIPDQPYVTTFTSRVDGTLTEIVLGHAVDLEASPHPKEMVISIASSGSQGNTATGILTSNFNAGVDVRGESYTIPLDAPLAMIEGVQVQLSITLRAESGAVTLAGAAPANETTWDDGLPLRVDGYDGYGGIYQPGLNFEMYWDDNAEKLERFVTTLDQADYLFISSSRQWGSTVRIPERYPLTIAYYRHLLGCPAERSIEWCYASAQVGDFQGDLGYELIQVFDSSPSLGPLRFNTQFAEEAFTVYDHPKVFIFEKAADYNAQQVRQILGAVDLTQVVHVTPKRAEAFPGNLMLPLENWAEQQAGGTWSDLFNTDALYNRYPFLGAVIWYACLALLGIVIYPLLRLGLPGLEDRGYPLARTAGLLVLSYLVWLAGSAGIPFTRLTIGLVLGALLIAGLWAAYHQRDELQGEIKQRRNYFLLVEGLFLAFFLFDLFIRFGNPDLWHPWKGGEKPMDFAYFNAVLKSTTFPPYDPWFAGGYLNYYYYGFVFLGSLVKFLGIVPSIAYNLILPTVFALIALGAFSLGWNLTGGWRRDQDNLAPRFKGLWAGLAAALGMAVLGNLGTVRMIFQGYQRLVAPGGVIEGAGLLQRWEWALRGALLTITGTNLPYGLGDWYWIPSRAIPAPEDVEPITEFPFFTVLYGDPHAHLFALPIALLVLGWALSVVMGRVWSDRGSAIRTGMIFLLGGLAIGALGPTNTWDFYTYLALGAVAVAYSLFNHYRPGAKSIPIVGKLPESSQRMLVAVGGALLLVLLSLWLYQPYANWYGLGYSKVDIWKGTHTPISAYFTHWGLFLFVILSWMAWETREWMAATPVSALRKLAQLKPGLYTSGLLMFVILIGLAFLKVRIGWVVLPLAVWAGVLLLRPGLSEARRFILFLVGTGLVLTLMVEVIVLRGDIGRMNTVFKFYLQVWTLFAVSAAAALGWLIRDLSRWTPRWRASWQVILIVLVAGAGLFPLLGGAAKIEDRMDDQAPHTLDGMAFMTVAEYPETWGVMDLSQDYRAIRWMQENVEGSPVIVEANLRNLYRWGSRFSIYTGLPGVVGWEWHQQQQRAVLANNQVSERIAEVDNFYLTSDLEEARQFLTQYGVRYIILGQQELGHYMGDGLAKFPAADGALWREVYQDGDTTIYEVIPH